MWRTQHYADQDYIWPESSQTFSCNYDSLDSPTLCGKFFVGKWIIRKGEEVLLRTRAAWPFANMFPFL